ncbi:MotE family protein [Sediminibacillus albus]|uniref:Flagellar motility protein MotE, a chaperone for MotC folding n=1 Tax=Sediminibacillus albus TaxID=407036 RepID=A0A1G8W206_9BACI|nr:hypothetical protein [Sediminibacillus albus]SDJ72401.1 Flagellar motility protein MotE, a chaperone for MotC folding [Sediminibacillus albus]
MASKARSEKEKTGIFQLLLFIFIPLILVCTFALIIMAAAGVDVPGYAKKYAGNIPGVASLVSTEAEEGDMEGQKQIESAISAKDEQIEQLEAELETRESEINELNMQIEDLQQEMAAEEEDTSEEQTDVIADISTSFQNMESENAAVILANLDENTALLVMEKISKKTMGSILGEMDPDEAARLTNAYASQDN